MIKFKSILLSGAMLVATMFVMPMFVDAQFVDNGGFQVDEYRGGELGVGTAKPANLTDTIFKVIKGLLSIVFVIAVLVFVIAGLIFLTSAGSGRADLARDMLTYAIIGLVVSVLGYAMVVFLSNALIDR